MQQLEERNFEHKSKTFVLKLFGTQEGFSVDAIGRKGKARVLET